MEPLPQLQTKPAFPPAAHLPAASPGDRALRRQLLVEDSLKLSSLLAITIVLAFITWLLFQSFTDHRHLLELRWNQRGQQALAAGRSAEAIDDFRAALELAPANRSYLLSLAQALAATGRTVEATAYFNTLRDAQPGSALINLQLARLAAGEVNTPKAVEYYRAAIYGTWEGDGSVQRLETRLELIRYLIGRRDIGTARTELLIAEGNAPVGPSPVRLKVLSEIAPLFEQIDDPAEALVVYRAILTLDRNNPSGLFGAARAASSAGKYRDAIPYLERFLALNPPPAEPSASLTEAKNLLDQNRQILAIAPLPNLPPGERAARILRALNLAQTRLSACLASPDPPVLTDLTARWQAVAPIHAPTAPTAPDAMPPAPASSTASTTRPPNRDILAADIPMEQNLWHLVADTEIQTAAVCSPPTGTDAALLAIAHTQFFQE